MSQPDHPGNLLLLEGRTFRFNRGKIPLKFSNLSDVAPTCYYVLAAL